MRVLFVCFFLSKFLLIFSVFLSLSSPNSSSLSFSYLFLPSFSPVFFFIISALENLYCNAVWATYFCHSEFPIARPDAAAGCVKSWRYGRH